jgi:hypothetical protein
MDDELVFHEGNNIAGHWYLCDGYDEDAKFHLRLGLGDADYFYDVEKFWDYACNAGTLSGLEPDLNGKELTLLAPDGGEILLAEGDTVITCTSTNVSDIKIEYTLDNGASWEQITASTPAGDGSYEWTTPDE